MSRKRAATVLSEVINRENRRVRCDLGDQRQNERIGPANQSSQKAKETNGNLLALTRTTITLGGVMQVPHQNQVTRHSAKNSDRSTCLENIFFRRSQCDGLPPH